MRWLGNLFLVVALASLVAALGVRFWYHDLAGYITPDALLRFTDTCVLFAILFHLKHFIDERARPSHPGQEVEEDGVSAPPETPTETGSG